MSSSSSSTTGGARLVITKQESPEQEAIHKNGENKLLHSVIKNVPFVIDLGLEGDFDRSAINFNRCTLEATLMYDSREDKPVHYVSRRPVEYNCTVDKAAGDKVKVECTLNVLSSQHEGAHFRLRFTAASLALHVLSDPIRVVSKPLQLKKVKEQRKAAAAAAAQAAASSSALEGKTVTGKKRPLSDSIQDTLARIEAQQQAQQTLISSLFQTVMAQLPLTPATSVPNTPLATASPVSSPCSQATASPAAIFAQPATPPAKRRRLDPNTTPPSAPEPREDTFTFESHLRGLIESFHAIAPSHRAQAVHSAVTKATPMQVEKLSGLVDVFCAEGLGRTAHMISLSAAPLSAPSTTTTTTSSSTRVPHHPWQLSSASSPLISAGADASDDDDATASWLSTETSPMSPGDQSASSQASTSTFSFDSIEVMFPADGHVASSSSQKPTTMLGDWDHNDAEDEIYNELFSLLDQGEASPSF